jgi:hypothetical protein
VPVGAAEWMLPRLGCGVGAPVVLASLRAPGALLPVLARPRVTACYGEPGCAQVRVPCVTIIGATISVASRFALAAASRP